MPAVDRSCGYFQPELEIMSREKRRAYQLDLLKRRAARAFRDSAGSRRRFTEAGLDPEAITSLEDLVALPLIHKRDYASIQKSDPPFGGFSNLPPGNLAHIYVSPGPIYDPEGGEKDFWNLVKPFYAGGFRPGDIVQNTFSYHLTPAGMMCDLALREIGCAVVPTGTGNTEIQASTMRDLKVTGYVGTPSYLMTILERAREMGIDPRADLALEMAYVAAEILPPSMRKKLSGDYGLHVRQGYITADLGAIGFECSEADGLHVPEDIIVEIVSPADGRPAAPGEVGEVVVTTLKESYPLFRFATGDLSALMTEERCGCGRCSPRLKGVLGRADEVTKVRGMFVHPGMIADILERAMPGLAGQAVVTRPKYQDEITLRVVAASLTGQAFEETARKLKEAAKDIIKLRVEVEQATPEELGPRPKKIEDKRTWE